MNKNNQKRVLDVCCGGRMFWFDKKNKDALFLDIRQEDFQTGKGKDNRHRAIKPDKVMDFRKLKIPSSVYHLVVFDPPHLFAGRKSFYAQIYGQLDQQTWQEDLRKGFSECFRVLRPNGVLIFKWNESSILLREILALTPVAPLFGHRSGKASKTHWVAFMKPKPLNK